MNRATGAVDDALASLILDNAAFACDLYLALAPESGNLFFAPYSISTALAATYAGARGETERQMARALHFDRGHAELHAGFEELERRMQVVQEKGKVLLKLANGLWPGDGYPFLATYLALIRRHYGAEVTPVHYGDGEAARAKINAWVEERTEGRIRQLIASGILDELTRLVLVNAIYFKGSWLRAFDSAQTRPAPFYRDSGEAVERPMMAQQGEFGYVENETFQALELPYAGQDLSMVVVLPQRRDGLPEIEDALTGKLLRAWTEALRETEVRVLLPRFKVSCGFSLKEALLALGMVHAFDPTKADLSGMDGIVNWLYVGAVLHKAFVEVNEEGTEAAAATAVVVKARGLPAPVPVFRADHPFLFFIRHTGTGSILFIGRVVDPLREQAA